jgi:uncharacterized repeat protein (TIGR01451 family)
LQVRPVVVATGMSDIQLSETAVLATALPVRVMLDQDRDPVRSGDTVTYTATFANVETVNAPNTGLSIAIPSGVTFLSASHDGVLSAGVVRWALGTLSAGESGERRLTVAVNSATLSGSVIVTRAALTDTTVPPDSARATAVCAVVAAMPISITLDANPSPVFSYGSIRAVLTVANQSGSDYGNVVVRLRVPTSTNFYSGAAYPTPVSGGSYYADAFAAWNLGTLPAGQSRTIVVPFSLSSSLADGAVRQFLARVDTAAGTRANASQVVVIDSTPALVLAIEEDRDPVAAGETLSYKVVIGNSTSIAAPNVTMKASLPTGTVFVSANGGGTHSAGVVTWNLGTVGAGKSGERNFTVRVSTDVANGTVLTARVIAEDTLEPQDTARASTSTSVRAAVPLTLGFSFTSNLYTLAVGNRGSTDLGGVTVYALTPDNLNYYSGNASPSPDSGGSYYGGDLARWTLGSLFAGQTRTITVPLNFSSSSRAGNGSLISYQAIVVQPANDLVVLRELTLRIGDPTQITLQPRSVSTTLGGTVTLSATVGGSDLLLYQWRFNGQDIPGATNSALTLTNVQSSQAGAYTLAITDSNQTYISDAATLTVNVVPALTTQPANQTVTAAGNASFTVAASGTPAPTLQWQVSTNGGSTWTDVSNGGVYSGATTGTLAITGATAGMTGYQYRCVATNAAGAATSNAVTLTVMSSSYLANLSVRVAMAAGQTLIVGFVVDGGAKPILVRAAGPVLNKYGLIGVVDPQLKLFTGGGTQVAANDNWDAALAATFATLGAFPFDAASKDAALQQTINGPHSAQATATGSGAILVEAYDAGPNDSRKLVNLSTRFQVGTGDNILIAGFVLSGTGTRQLLIRAVGPTLTNYGVTGVLADPQLAVFDVGTPIASNNDWASSLSATFTTLGAFPLNAGSKDAAIVVTLQAGKPYSVQVSGVGSTTGEALVEIYLMP